VSVSAGATATHDFELAPTTASGKAQSDEVVRLGEFVVSTEPRGPGEGHLRAEKRDEREDRRRRGQFR